MKNLTLQKNGDIASILFNNSQSRNALDEATARTFLSILEEVDQDVDIRVLIIQGNGAFCSGVDLCVLDDIGTGRKWNDLGDLIEELFNPIVKKLCGMKKPTIAVIDGVAAGGGMSLALACDFRFGTMNAKFVPAHSRLGLIPDCGGTWFLRNLLGPAKALEIAVFSNPINAHAAKDMGLLTWLSNEGDPMADLMQRTVEVARLPRLALLKMRDIFINTPSTSLAQALDTEGKMMSELGNTRDHIEGLQAFREKRQPHFLC